VSDLSGDDPVLQSDVGFGAEAQVRYTPSAFSFGVGFQWTTHSTHIFDSIPVQFPTISFVDEPSVQLYGVFFEPRYTININSNSIAPYVSARLSGLKVKNEVSITDGTETVTLTSTATGVAINGGGGILVRLSSRINLDAGVTVGYISFGDLTLEFTPSDPAFPPQTIPTDSGTNILGRLGFAIGL